MTSKQLDNVHSDFSGYNQLITLVDSGLVLLGDKLELNLKTYFEANLASVLGGIIDYFNLGHQNITLSASPGAESILRKNRFLVKYGYSELEDSNLTTIPFHSYNLNDLDGFSGFIRKTVLFGNNVGNELLNRTQLPNMSTMLRKKVLEGILEIYNNAYLHSHSNKIYTCGQFYPRLNLIKFTITDMGIGFKQSVNSQCGRDYDSLKAVKWALTEGKTTKQATGGLGLSILQEFIMKNKGKFQIVTGDAFYEITDQRINEAVFDKVFPGSIVHMEFRTDDTYSYRLSSENIDNEDVF